MISEETITLGIRLLDEIITIIIFYLLIKRLIRYGIEYYFRLKTYNDGRREIDEIQQDIIKEHPAKEDKP